jgi:hypothetical protein
VTGRYVDAISTFTSVLFIAHSVYWFYLTRKDLQARASKALTQEESRCILYTIALVVNSLWFFIAWFIWPAASWQDLNEETLASYHIAQILLTVFVTGSS